MRGRKRKKHIITIEQMKAYQQLSEHLQLDRILNHTTIFKERINGGSLDVATTEAIKETFTLWFNSWIHPNLSKM